MTEVSGKQAGNLAAGFNTVNAGGVCCSGIGCQSYRLPRSRDLQDMASVIRFAQHSYEDPNPRDSKSECNGYQRSRNAEDECK